MRASLRRPLTLAAAAVTAAALAACSSSATTAAAHGTETLTATVTGKAAAANLNSDSSAPLSFAAGTLAGPVTATIKPLVLGGGNGCSGNQAWHTTAGPLAVTHTSQPKYCENTNAPPPATWTLSGTTCHFTATFSAGTFAEIKTASGAFAATTWHGNYKVTAEGYAPLAKGKTACSFQDAGAVEADGASIVFTASGPLAKG